MDTIHKRFTNLVSKPVGPGKKKKKTLKIWGVTEMLFSAFIDTWKERNSKAFEMKGIMFSFLLSL